MIHKEIVVYNDIMHSTLMIILVLVLQRRGAREPWIAAMTALSCFVARVVIVSVSQSRIVTSKHWTLD